MLRPYGPGMPDDAMSHRYGFDGNESVSTMSLCREHSGLGIRSTFALSTYYPNIHGGYYENRALFELIEEPLRALELLPVILECYANAVESIVPIEGEGQLLVDEQYALVRQDGTQAGLLQVWRFHVGGGGAYYSDNIIFDLILPEPVVQQLVDDVEERCRKAQVRFTREAAAQPCATRVSGLGRILRYFWGG